MSFRMLQILLTTAISVGGWGSSFAPVFAADSIEQTVVVVLDDSGSMDERMRTESGRVRRIDAAKSALTEVLGKLPPQTTVGVLALNTNIQRSHWIVPLGPANPRIWKPNIQSIRAVGGTPLGEFLKLGADELLAARAKRVFGTYRLLIVTDGEANDQNLVDAYLPDILARGIQVDVIGVDMAGDHSLAQRAHSYRRADDDRALAEAISQVFAETSADDQDAAADFEMLADLPDEFAVQAVKVLTTRNDAPIEAIGKPTQLGVTYNSSGQPVSVFDRIATIFSGLFCCLAPVVVFGIVVLLIQVAKKN